jgi:chaperone modulatory protein CbpM
MITVDVLLAQVSGLQHQTLERWILNKWVRPDGSSGKFLFNRIDAARVRLIWELLEQLEIDETALPTILSLLDQLYDLRRSARQLNEALALVLPQIQKREVSNYLERYRPRGNDNPIQFGSPYQS